MNNTYLKNLNKERERLLKSDKENLEKIELSSIDDFEKEYKNATDLYVDGMAFTTDIDNAAKKVIDLYDKAGKSYLKANARSQEIEEATKDLGIEVPTKLVKLREDISQTLKDIDKASKNLLKIINTDKI